MAQSSAMMDSGDNRLTEAKKEALAMFRRKDWYEAEVREKLLLKGYEDDITDVVIEFLRERRILSDSRTLQSAVDASIGRKAKGRSLLEASARQRGASDATIEAILSVYSADDERAAILELLRIKYTQRGNRAQAGRFLISRGFDEDLVDSALDDYFGEPLVE